MSGHSEEAMRYVAAFTLESLTDAADELGVCHFCTGMTLIRMMVARVVSQCKEDPTGYAETRNDMRTLLAQMVTELEDKKTWH